METPQTLIEAVRTFSDKDTSREYIENLRWPDGIPACPHCEHKGASFLSTRKIWKCKSPKCRRQFSVKVGTIFEDSPLGFDKWLPAIWLIANAKNGISSHELGRSLGVTQKTAWFMLHRIRLAMQTESFEKLNGTVEVDETFIGGQARYMHKDKREEKIKGRGPGGKAIVLGLFERHGEVRTRVVPDTKQETLQGHVRRHVDTDAEVFTDESPSYRGLSADYVHEVINHAETYVRGKVHTNGLENY